MLGVGAAGCCEAHVGRWPRQIQIGPVARLALVLPELSNPTFPTVAVITTTSSHWKSLRPRRFRPVSVIAPALLVVIFASVGCHRQFYRRQADLEVNSLLEEKNRHIARPSSAAPRIDVDRRSRMFNPFDLDFQPMPTDDPASYRYMEAVDGRRGYPLWQASGVTNTAESPDWWQFLPLDEDGVLVLNSENAVQIAMLHSPEYQEQLEDLYLSALAVSAERFQFDTQFFGGAEAIFTTDGPRRGFGTGSSTTVEVGPSSAGRRDLAMQRRFATGADLVVGVANNIVWELSGPNSQSASTVLDFSLLQPLLRGAGRDRVLERLTFSERALLANVRAFERYRRSFFLNVTIGRPLESRPGVNGPSTNVSGNAFTSAGGFLGLLETQLQIRNSEENIARLKESLVIAEDALIESLTTIPDNTVQIITERLQVEQTRSQLLNAETGLINQQVAFQRSVDAFLRTLGLPPYICVRLDDPILDSFELIDRDLRGRREELSNLRSGVGEINVSILDAATFEEDPSADSIEPMVDWTPQIADSVRELRDRFAPLVNFNETLIRDDMPRVREDIELLEETLPERRTQNESLRNLYRREQQQICSLLNLTELDESVLDISELEELGSDLNERYVQLIEQFESFDEQIAQLYQVLDTLVEDGPGVDDPRVIAQQLRDDVIVPSQELLSEIGEAVLAAQLIQARARSESVMLPDVDIDAATALAIARRNRRDWANARAELVDSWRLIEFNADQLESTLDLTFSGDVQNVGSNPLDLRTNTGRLRVGLQWDAPITRLLERNNYRSALIDYERAKRNYYSFEDTVWQLLRAEVRQLQANQLNFELGRQSLRVAASQIELNEDRRAASEARGQRPGPTAARDNIEALDRLLRAQNSLLNIFVSNEVVRRGLFFDLGTMELTSEGLWIDPGEIDTDMMLSLAGTDAGGMIHSGLEGCGLPLRGQPQEPDFGMLQDDGTVMEEIETPDAPSALEPASDPPLDTLPPNEPEGTIETLPADPSDQRRDDSAADRSAEPSPFASDAEPFEVHQMGGSEQGRAQRGQERLDQAQPPEQWLPEDRVPSSGAQ